jgi:hypothetical protein
MAADSDSKESFRIHFGPFHISTEFQMVATYTSDMADETQSVGLKTPIIFLRNEGQDPRWIISGTGRGGVDLYDTGHINMYGGLTLERDANGEVTSGHEIASRISPLLATNIRKYLKEKFDLWKNGEGRNVNNFFAPFTGDIEFEAPLFIPTLTKREKLKREKKASAEGLATVSAMWNRQRPEAAASNAAAAPAAASATGRDGLPPDVTRNIAAMLGLPKKGGSRRKPRRLMSKKYCKRTPCRNMGFTQKASCRPTKNCYRKTRRRLK